MVGEVLKAARKGSLSSCGVCGRLGDLGSIDPKYDVAVSTAADMLDHVVVETAPRWPEVHRVFTGQKLGQGELYRVGSGEEGQRKADDAGQRSPTA